MMKEKSLLLAFNRVGWKQNFATNIKSNTLKDDLVIVLNPPVNRQHSYKNFSRCQGSVLVRYCTYNKSFHYISKQTSCLHDFFFSIWFRNFSSFLLPPAFVTSASQTLSTTSFALLCTRNFGVHYKSVWLCIDEKKKGNWKALESATSKATEIFRFRNSFSHCLHGKCHSNRYSLTASYEKQCWEWKKRIFPSWVWNFSVKLYKNCWNNISISTFTVFTLPRFLKYSK